MERKTTVQPTISKGRTTRHRSGWPFGFAVNFGFMVVRSASSLLFFRLGPWFWVPIEFHKVRPLQNRIIGIDAVPKTELRTWSPPQIKSAVMRASPRDSAEV